jgi:class 3 adenylate cyclase
MPDEQENPQSLERKLATILSADVAEFSRLMGEDEEGTLRTFRGHKQVFESLVAMHRGRIFNTAGDAILAEFNSAVEAVRCATDIQAALRTLNDKLPRNRQVRFRIGINLGDVMVQGVDLMGDGVNVAARLQTAAEPGGICISGSVHDQIRNKLSLSFVSLGEKNYKNIQQPVRTFSISDVEGAGALPAAQPESHGAKSGALKWFAAAAVLLLAGGGYWAYTANQRGKTESAKMAVVASPPAVTPPPASTPPAPSPETSPAASSSASSAPALSAPASPPPSANKLANSGMSAAAGSPARSSSGASAPPAAHSHTPPRAGTESSDSLHADDGTYAGPICFAETKKEPHRCFRQHGSIAGRKITGQWFMGPEKKILMVMDGDVSKNGNVVIELVMHSETVDGERLGSISLQGTLRDGEINTSGTFRNGRPATLDWRKNEE